MESNNTQPHNHDSSDGFSFPEPFQHPVLQTMEMTSAITT
ncbi:hypothetical protein SynA15127_02768 [Synechococcus sp. A15-127]|nr:hypothetical protein SynA15127_02768 [Synechococcus sp. A15-127]